MPAPVRTDGKGVLMSERNLTVVETPSTLATTDPFMRRLGAERRIWLVEHSHPGRIPELGVPGVFLINYRELWTTTEASAPGQRPSRRVRDLRKEKHHGESTDTQ